MGITPFVTNRRPSSLILSWMEPLNSSAPQSRSRCAVGELFRDSEGISFRYLTKNPSFSKAVSKGFVEFPAFPLTDPAYVFKNTMDFFSRRLPDKDRPDISTYLKSFGLDPDGSYDDFTLLGLTGGRVTSDSFEFVDPLTNITSQFTTLLDVAGVRHYPNGLKTSVVGTKVSFMHDAENKSDPNAIKIINNANEQIGWVNALQCEAILPAVKKNNVAGKIFRINGRPSYPRIYIMTDIEGTVSSEIAA